MPKKRSKSPKRTASKKKSPSSPPRKRAKSKTRKTSENTVANRGFSKQSVPVSTPMATQVSEGSLENILNQLGGHNRWNSYNTRSYETRGRPLYRSARSNKMEPLTQSNNQNPFRNNSFNDMEPLTDEEIIRNQSSQRYLYPNDQISDGALRNRLHDISKQYQQQEYETFQRAEETRPAPVSYQRQEHNEAMSTYPNISLKGYQRENQISHTNNLRQKYDHGYEETPKSSKRSFAPREVFPEREPEINSEFFREYQRDEQIAQTNESVKRYDQHSKETPKIMERTFASREVFLDKEPEMNYEPFREYQRDQQIAQTNKSVKRYEQNSKEIPKIMERSFAPRETFLDKESDTAPEPKSITIQYEVIPPAKAPQHKDPPMNSRFSRSSRDSTDYFVNRTITKMMGNRGRQDYSNTTSDLNVRPTSRQISPQNSSFRNGSRAKQEFQTSPQENRSSPYTRFDEQHHQHHHDFPSPYIRSNEHQHQPIHDIPSLYTRSNEEHHHHLHDIPPLSEYVPPTQDLISPKMTDQADSHQDPGQTAQNQHNQFETPSHLEREKTFDQEISYPTNRDISLALPAPARQPLEVNDDASTTDVPKRPDETNEAFEENLSYKQTTPNLILYYDIVSPQSRSCLMLICLLKLDVDLRYTDIFKGDQLTEEYLKINPVHTVPTLVTDDMIFTDSHTILMYLCDNSNNPLAQQLYPQNYMTRLKIMNCLFFEAQVLYRRHSNFMTEIVRKEFANIDYAFHEKKILEAYETLNSFLKESKYLAGSSMTIADISMVATISALDLMFPVDQYQNIWPELAQWFRNMRSIPMYRLNFAGVMKQSGMVEKIGKFEFPFRGSDSGLQ